MKVVQYLKCSIFQLPKDIMTSIYKLVAERRDRNQSMRRKRNNRNINLFKDSIEEVQYRRPTLYRNSTFRQRTVSDQLSSNESKIVPVSNQYARRPTSDIQMINIKNQINDVDRKVDALTKKIEDLSSCIVNLKMELNKK